MLLWLIWGVLFPIHVMAKPVSLFPGFVADPNMPIPRHKPMNPYSLPEKYENIPLNEIYPEKFSREKFEKLVKVIKQQESGNQHYNKEGLVKIGKAGEVGLMQIKPLGNLGGGLKGIRRPILEDKELNERIGRIYLTNILEDPIINYDIPSAIMAWNRGLGKHKKWVAKGRNKEELPSWTKNYLKAAEKAFPKAFVQKKEEIAPAPVVKKETPAPVVEEPKVSIDQAMKMSIPDYKYMLDKVSVPRREIFADMIKGIVEHYINAFDDPKIIRQVRDEVLRVFLDNPENFKNRRLDTGKPVFPKNKMEGGFVSA